MSAGPVGRHGIVREVDDHLGIITIDRADKHNALTLAMAHEIRAAAEELDADPDVWALLLRSSGDRSFCAGGDVGELLPQAFEAGSDVMHPDPETRFFSRVYTPIVCAIQGFCFGGGFELMLGTDIRIASERATFGLPEVGMGLISGGGSSIVLPQQVGWVRAMDLMLTGDSVGADEALAMGLVTEVVEHDTVQERALERARRLTRNAPRAMRAVKEIAARSRTLEPHHALEHRLTGEIIVSPDAAAGIEAFGSRTTPEFTGR